MGVALGEAVDLDLAATEGETDRSVEQHVVVGDAGARAGRAEPRIGELEVGEGVVGGGPLQVALHAEYEPAELPVVAGLAAAGDAPRLGAAVGDAAPLTADVDAEIGPHPAV